jgi:hypothetical protein
VQDKATLEDSLELFVGEELFSGDNKLEDPDAGGWFGVLWWDGVWCGGMCDFSSSDVKATLFNLIYFYLFTHYSCLLWL